MSKALSNKNNKKPLHKQRLMTASYLLLVGATVASTYVLATSETLRMRTGLGSYAGGDGQSRTQTFNQWDAEALCKQRIGAQYPSRSVVSIDSRSTKKLQSDAYHVVVQVDAPGHYSNDIDYVICRANLDSGYVSSHKLGDDEPKQTLGMQFKSLF